MAKNPLIYVIDDNAMLRALINQQLQNTLACEVVSFEHADNVLDDWNSVTPDLVILDYQFEIPDLKYKNGLQFLHALRSQSNVPVIALTGQSEKEVMSTLIKQGESCLTRCLDEATAWIAGCQVQLKTSKRWTVLSILELSPSLRS